MSVKSNVDFILRTKCMTRQDMASGLGVSKQSLSTTLGAKNIGLETIKRMAKVLGVRPADIVATPPLSYKNRYKNMPKIAETQEGPTTVNIKCPCCGGLIHLTAE